jgi:hypothetical protein
MPPRAALTTLATARSAIFISRNYIYVVAVACDASALVTRDARSVPCLINFPPQLAADRR